MMWDKPYKARPHNVFVFVMYLYLYLYLFCNCICICYAMAGCSDAKYPHNAIVGHLYACLLSVSVVVHLHVSMT